MTDFLTLEDVNSVVAEYYNTPFWDSVVIDTGNGVDFTDIKFDYLEVDRTYNNGDYTFVITPKNNLLQHTCYFKDADGVFIPKTDIDTTTSGVITLTSTTPSITCFFYCDIRQPMANTGFYSEFIVTDWIIDDVSPVFVPYGSDGEVTYAFKAVNPEYDLTGEKTFYFYTGGSFPIQVPVTDGVFTVNASILGNYSTIMDRFEEGINYSVHNKQYIRKLSLMPCFDTLTVGRVNHLSFVMETSNIINTMDYQNYFFDFLDLKCNYPISNKSRELVGTNSDILVSFDLDLRNVSKLVKVPLKFDFKWNSSGYNYTMVYSNEEYTFDTVYPTITTIAELSELFSEGGVGRLGSNLTLSADLSLSEDVQLIGNSKTITFASHKIIVPTGKTLKIEDTTITGGVNTIQQFNESIVELTDCEFSNCTSPNGVGGVIDCDVSLHSLDNPTDFKTTITNCEFTNCDCPILHGGDLLVTGCDVTGKLSNYNFPYFLYQTDGEAFLTGNTFRISSNSTINEDIKFNSCIFTCGANAIINNGTHDELTRNNVSAFLNNNLSSIDLTYYYDLIEADITLQSDRGFCHSTSGNDYVFKTNVTPQRSD